MKIPSPVLVGLSVVLVGSLLWFALEGLSSHLGAGSRQPTLDGILAVVLLVQLGYYLAAVPLIRRAGQRCLVALQPALNHADPELAKLTARFNSTGLPGLAVTAGIGLFLAITLQETQFQRFSRFLANPTPALGELCVVLIAWATWTIGLSSATLIIKDARAMQRVGGDHVVIDLVRLDQLAAFSQYGLFLAGVIIGLMATWAISLVALSTVVGNFWSETSLQVGLLMVLGYLVLMTAVFVFPQLGVRRRIREQKQETREQLTRLFPTPPETLSLASSDPERLAALLSSRSWVESLPEWPTRQHTHLRLGVYLLVPLLSAIAARLLQELIFHLIR